MNVRIFVTPKKESEEAGATAIGIAAYVNGEPFEVHSIYINEALSNKQRIKYVCNYVNENITKGERARLEIVNVYYSNVKLNDWDNLFIFTCKFRKRHEEARQ